MEKAREPDHFLAETKAGGMLLRYSITSPGFNIVALAKVLGLEVNFGGLEKIDAWLLRRDDGTGVIRVKASSNFNRQRFSIAHEIGHWTLHEGKSQGYLCTLKDLADYRRSPEEAEANIFAASLLIPRHFVDPAIFQNDPSFARIESLANQCKTSITSSARRVVELSSKKLMLVCALNGNIEWAISSKAAKWLRIDRENLPTKSITAKAYKTQSSITGNAPCHASVWFPFQDFARDAELIEEVRYFDFLGMTLTLLFLPT